MSEHETLQGRVGAWGEATFPDSTPESIVAHLRDEADELDAAVTPQHPFEGRAGVEGIAEEAADVFLLLLHLAHRYGFDLHEAAEEKFTKVQARTYTTDSGRGYTRHDDPLWDAVDREVSEEERWTMKVNPEAMIYEPE